MILDSDIIIDFLKNDKKVVKKISEIKEVEELKTTSINVFEILIGFFSLNKKEDKVINFINNLTILNFDFKASYISAEVFDKLKKSGNIIDALDLFIASIAISNNEELFTKNIQHFKKIPDLKIVTV